MIGANGKGKSTVLRMVAGTEEFTGERVWGHNVEESFYAQHQLEALTMTHTIMEEMQNSGSKKSDAELRSLMGAFLFGGDDIDKKIRVLSGGEKARVALAKTIVSKANFLILDEPTNHLDMHSVELLAEALNKYEGSYILVSHDRYFISKTANKIWEIVDNQIKEFKGTYQEWIEWNERMAKIGAENAKNEKPEQKASQPVVAPVVKQVEKNPINKDQQKELQQLQKQLQQLETNLNKAKTEKLRIEAAMGDPSNYSDKSKFVQLELDYKKTQAEWNSLNQDYEQTFEKIMELETPA